MFMSNSLYTTNNALENIVINVEITSRMLLMDNTMESVLED